MLEIILEQMTKPKVAYFTMKTIGLLVGQSPELLSWLQGDPTHQKDELIPETNWIAVCGNWQKMANSLEIKLGGSKEKVDQYSVTHVILDNVSANAENQLFGWYG